MAIIVRLFLLLPLVFSEEHHPGPEEFKLVLEEMNFGTSLMVLHPQEAVQFSWDLMMMQTNETRRLDVTIISSSTGATTQSSFEVQMVDDGNQTMDDERRRLVTTGGLLANIDTSDLPYKFFVCEFTGVGCGFQADISTDRRLTRLPRSAIISSDYSVFMPTISMRPASVVVAEINQNPVSLSDLFDSRGRWRPPPTTTTTTSAACIAGDATFQTQDGVLQAEDLQGGDMVNGIDYYGESTMCNVVMTVFEGFSTVYGNYTSDHLMLSQESGEITVHGLQHDARPNVQIYTILTSNCVALVDTEGQQPTAFSSRTCGLALNFEDLVRATRSLLVLHQHLGEVIFHPQTWMSVPRSDEIVPLCIRMVHCSKNITWCDALEESVSGLVSSTATNSLVSAWQRSLTSHVVRTNIAGQWAETPLSSEEPDSFSFSQRCNKAMMMTTVASVMLSSLPFFGLMAC